MKNFFEQIINIPYVILNFGNQFKKILYIIWLAQKWCGFQRTKQAFPISCQFPDGLIYQHVSDSVPSRVLIKLEQSRAMLAQHVKAPKQDLTQQLVLMRLGSLETSQAEPRELGRLQRLVTFTTTSHMSFHSDSFSHCLPTRTIEPKETYAYPLHAARFFVAFQI